MTPIKRPFVLGLGRHVGFTLTRERLDHIEFTDGLVAAPVVDASGALVGHVASFVLSRTGTSGMGEIAFNGSPAATAFVAELDTDPDPKPIVLDGQIVREGAEIVPEINRVAVVETPLTISAVYRSPVSKESAPTRNARKRNK